MKLFVFAGMLSDFDFGLKDVYISAALCRGFVYRFCVFQRVKMQLHSDAIAFCDKMHSVTLALYV